MKRFNFWIIIAGLLLALAADSVAKDVVRPVEIKSKRQVVYDKETYINLAGLWKDYFEAYPSEYAYANWMYAARYAGDEDYSVLLNKGIKDYPSNPTLLYLKSLECHGAVNNVKGLGYLEKAIALDPNFIDPWFMLVVHYMESGNKELLDAALRRLLESGIINDEVMDYNYNILLSLDSNAILITNGDNDTYPGWILSRILNFRPDVTIVNRSLLNTEWYPIYVIENGLPRFITKSELVKMRESIFEQFKKKKTAPPPGGLLGDTLILKIIESAKLAGRPVFFPKTLFITEQIEQLSKDGRDLGLVTLVTPSKIPYPDQLREIFDQWVNDYRTGGLKSWRLMNAPETDAGFSIIRNYAYVLGSSLESLKINAPEIRPVLFDWYIEYLEKLITDEMRSLIAQAWCNYGADIEEIKKWGKNQGLKCIESKE